jgi:hypothetical protein
MVLFDVRPDVPGWPVIAGCVTGMAPVVDLEPVEITNIRVGCGPISRVVAHVNELSGQGMVISAVLDPPIKGFEISYSPSFCARSPVADIVVNATGTAGYRTGDQVSTTLRVQVQGPGGLTLIEPLTFSVAPTKFMLDSASYDFGTVFPGSFMIHQVWVSNLADSAPIGQLTEAPVSSDPFFFSLPAPGAPALEPGYAAQMLTVLLSPSAGGSYGADFSVSPFAPGVFVDPSCGATALISLHATVLSNLP